MPSPSSNDFFYRGELSDEPTAVLIVDMIAAYLEEGQRLYCETCRKIIPAINDLTKISRSKKIGIYFCNTALKVPTDPIARRWGMHAIAGTKDCQLASGMESGPEDTVVPKVSYNAFFQTDLHSLLSQAGIRRVVIAGIHTHVCVLLTAAAADFGYDVVVVEDAITTSYEANHQSRLRFFSTHIGKLMKLADFKRALKH